MNATRRQVLKVGLSGLAAGMVGAPTLARGSQSLPNPARSTPRTLLIALELSGGNDSLNTVIPHSNPVYFAARPTLAIHDGLPLDDRFSFHPSLSCLQSLFRQGQVAIIHGVGYPQMTRSHFRSMEIWQSGEPGEGPTCGWLGRSLELMDRRRASRIGLSVDSELPLILKPSSSTRRLARNIRPETGRSSIERLCSQIDSESDARIFHAHLTGFDTHVNQLETHATALAELDRTIRALMARLESQALADRAVILCYSEFGRQVHENEAGGTDHGAAGTVLLCGHPVRGGLYGEFPSLTALDHSAQQVTTDFRQIYATLLDQWIGTNSIAVLKESFAPIDFI